MVGVPQDDSGDKSVLQKTQEHNQIEYIKAQQKAQQIRDQNAQVQQQRQNAPGSIKEGTFEAQQVKKEEAQDAQQAYFAGGFQQKGSTADSFVAQREAALKSGKFDYGAVKSSFYSPPSKFVNTKGETVVRTPNPAPEKAAISFGTPVSGTPAPTLRSPVLKISQTELQKSNALRASQGLPPLETVATIQIVSPTKGPTAQKPVTRITTGRTAPPDLRAKLAQAQGTLQPSGGGGEAVSFLRFPFSPNKGSSSGGIQSTTILDPLQFLGIEAGVSLATKGAEFVGSLIKSEGKTIIKEGAKDIGLNIKPSEAYLKAKSFEAQAARLPKPASVKPAKTPTVPVFTSTEVNLGKGLVRTTGKEGGTSATDMFKPSPPGKPSSSGTKEVTVGKGGLTQIVREKPPIQKTVTLREKPAFEQKQLQKQDQLLRQRLKPKQEVQLKQKQEQLMIVKPIQIQKEKLSQPQKQRQKQGAVIPISQNQKQISRPTSEQKTTTALLTQRQNQSSKQKQTLRLANPVINKAINVLTPPIKPTSKSFIDALTPPSRTTQTTEQPKRPQIDPLLGGAKSGALGKVSKSGARKGYIGNVPIESLVGVYKRSEVTYTNKSPSQLNQKQKISGNRNFKLLGSKSIKI